MDYYSKINECADHIKSRIKDMPVIGLILGSGLGGMADEIENATIFPYAELPHFPVSTVEGHSGQLVIGKLEGKTVVAMKGRFHFYEGYDLLDVTFPVRVMKALGITAIILTNAAGGLNRNFCVGDLMLLTDHINLTGRNPLIGPNDKRLGTRFPAVAGVYNRKMAKLGESIALSKGFGLRKGVYLWTTGPSYESGAELRMMAAMGADAVGMSTVPEAIVAAHAGIEDVLGISCVTNMALGDHDVKEEHENVVKAAAEAQPKFRSLIRGVIREY
ncbi:MAG: purine-nucleoside phosphorylase [Candidatus Wallbacteria bacterium HGW-Wallbacteria-1]|jgi:purine-nucleoside phosphorylase|uniref:Purine nucleoside phosphorylase n=1 Tax=Candidatus Wallbacteria bacterium HGW-Wallbacteria-1 TaxID=2013854 RepID=A0A2N1PVA1_9BACT|nr:MAG: purine-nucleoside phosphorylase [Candidatus Wallbacteria bacterium HGW-Wallbacteria-1]